MDKQNVSIQTMEYYSAFTRKEIVPQATTWTILEDVMLSETTNSGTGSYHSKFSFDTFFHHRAGLLSASGLEKLKDIRYSPFSACKQQLLSWALGDQRRILL
eukprot:XP_028342519.1 aldehyde dehydrogenase family 3 member B2-like [Physeter catodon]